jgi:CBS domain-containing protein
MTIRELMTGGLITVHPETPVRQARDLMGKERIRHLPVTGPGGALVGIVTDRDIRLNLPSRATSLSAQEITHLLLKLTVGEIMTRLVITIGPDSPAREAARLMLDHKIGALPVLDDGRLVGIITETDIVRAFIRTTAPAGGFRP